MISQYEEPQNEKNKEETSSYLQITPSPSLISISHLTFFPWYASGSEVSTIDEAVKYAMLRI